MKKLLANKWVKFALATVLWVLIFVVWMRNAWMLLGVPLIFDWYITGFFRRHVLEHHRRARAKNRVYKTVAEWVEAIVFAVVVASLIHLFVFQMYVIPTPSMEKTLLVGDYLYVSKLTYGPRMPNTPLALPLVHNTMPFSATGAKSYSEAIKRPYKRLAGLKPVRHDDVVVFNYPADDASRPVDKRENYVKRCVALPGDSVRLVASRLYVNGVAQKEIPGMQQMYYVAADAPFSQVALDNMGIAQRDLDDSRHYYLPPEYLLPLTAANLEKVRAMKNVLHVEQYERGGGSEIFPNSPALPALRNLAGRVGAGWTENDFGPLWIPAKGATVALTLENLPMYELIIDVYEENDLRVEGDTIYINGTPASEYTFKMDYYWMMGDNRQDSLDSRFWGFVPEDHIVGKASFVWLSLDGERGWFDGKVRWSKMFRKVR